MPALIRLAAVAAALAVLAGGAIYFAGSQRPSLAPQTSSPSATPIASVVPSASPYVLPSTTPNQTGQRISSAAHPGLRVDLPAGWTAFSGSETDPLYVSLSYGPDNHPAGGVTIRANPILGGESGLCGGTLSDIGAGRSVAAIVAALLSDPRLATVAGPATTVDGRPTQALDIGLSQTFMASVVETCGPGSAPQAVLFGKPGSLIAIDGDRRVRVILLDVDGVPLLILAMPIEEQFDAFVTRAMGVVDAITFLP